MRSTKPSMTSIIAVHMKRMVNRSEYKIAFCFFSIICCISFIEECLHYQNFDTHALPSAALGWIGHYSSNVISLLPICLFLFFPLLSSIVYSDSLIMDAQKGVAGVLALRTTIKRYLLASSIVMFMGAFLLFVIPLGFSLLISFFVFPIESSVFSMKVSLYSMLEDPVSVTNFLLGNIYTAAPYMYDVIRILYIGVFAGTVALVTFAISLHTSWNRFIVLGSTSLIYLVATLVLPTAWRPGHFLLPTFFADNPSLFVWIGCPVVLFLSSLFAIWYASCKRDVFL